MISIKRKYRLLITVSELMHSSQVRNLCDLVSGIDKNLFSIDIGAMAVGDEATEEVKSLGVPLFQLRLMPARLSGFKKNMSFLKGPLILSQKNYDIVHSLLYQSLFTEPFLIKLISKAKYVYTKSNLQWDNHKLNWYLKSLLADKIISISQSIKELLVSKGFQKKIEKIYLGIDTHQFKLELDKRNIFRRNHGIPDDYIIFGCAAQFMKIKDHPTLIRAFEMVCQRYNNTYLLLCGPNHNDNYFKSVVSQIKASPFSEKIKLLGTIKDMPSFYSAIDCFVLPSYWEALPYVISEAMSSCRPVIGCRVHGPVDMIVEEETGYLLRPSDVEALSERMAKYINNPELIYKHGNAGRKRVKDLFSKEAMASNFQNLYLDLLQRK